jgi:O-antigen/teichoic acid export membrane protein
MSIAREHEQLPLPHRGKTLRFLYSRRVPSLGANFSWMLVANAVYAGSQWGIMILLARLASIEAVGEFAFAIAVTAPIMVSSMLSLRAIQATDASGAFEFREFLALRFATTSVAMVVIVAFALIGTPSIEMTLLILSAGTMAAADSISDILHGALQQRERLDCVAAALLIKGPAAMAAVTLTAGIGGGAAAAILAMSVVRWSVLLIYEAPIVIRALHVSGSPDWRLRWQSRRLRHLATMAFPLGVVTVLLSLQNNIPRYFLSYHAGSAELGIFATLLALTQLGALVVNALGQAASPRMARHFQAGESHAFFLLAGKLVLLGSALGVLAVLLVTIVGDKFLIVVFGSGADEHSRLFKILMVAAAVTYAYGPLGYAATASRRIRSQAAIQVMSLLVLTLVAWGVSSTGAVGMAWALLASSVTTATLFIAILATDFGATAGRPRQRLETQHLFRRCLL